MNQNERKRKELHEELINIKKQKMVLVALDALYLYLENSKILINAIQPILKDEKDKLEVRYKERSERHKKEITKLKRPIKTKKQ